MMGYLNHHTACVCGEMPPKPILTADPVSCNEPKFDEKYLVISVCMPGYKLVLCWPKPWA